MMVKPYLYTSITVPHAAFGWACANAIVVYKYDVTSKT